MGSVEFISGIAYTFGLFLPELVTSFNSTKSVITWAGSLLSGFYLSAGPVVSALTNKYGCRKVRAVWVYFAP